MLVGDDTIIPHGFTISICSLDGRAPQITTGALVLRQSQSLVSTQMTRLNSKECLCSAVSTCGKVRWYKIQLMNQNPWETWRRRWYTLRSKNMQTVTEVCNRFYIFLSVHYRNARKGKYKIRQYPTRKTTLSFNNIKERLSKTNTSV